MTPIQLQPQGPEQSQSFEKAPMLPPTEGVPTPDIGSLPPVLSGEMPTDQPATEDIRAARLDELRALEADGQIVARKGTAQELGDRAVERATQAKQTGIPVEVRNSGASDIPVFH